MQERKVYTLKQIGTAIKNKIDEATQGASYWVTAEIASFKVSRHAYLELVQHEGEEKVAVMKGIIWGGTLERVMRELGDDSHNILKEGVETLFLARPNFHLVYGLSLVIEAIDHTYTISALERRKQETVATLKAEGLYDLNRETVMPLVVQRIALVASPGTAAYADFRQHLERNEHGYTFHVSLFSTMVQGDTAANEMRDALAVIDPARYDVVVVIRGGGSRLDLEPFNDLELARAAARLPIPLLTGIGHDTDISVLDLIAHGHHKTPTAVADWIVDHNLYFESELATMLTEIHNNVLTAFADHKESLTRAGSMLALLPINQCQTERGNLHTYTNRFARQVTAMLTASLKSLDAHGGRLSELPLNRLRLMEQPRLQEIANSVGALARHNFQLAMQRMGSLGEAIELLSPQRVLERGFSIARSNGQAVSDATTLKPGDELVTTFAKGRAWSTVQKIEAHGEGEEADL